jgi:hypothetical protein
MFKGKDYNAATPIASDAYQIAKHREACWLGVRYQLHHEQCLPENIRHTGIFRRVAQRRDWSPLNTHDAIHHGDMKVGRLMEHVRR